MKTEIREVTESEFENISAKLQAEARLSEIMRLEARLLALRVELLPYLTKEIHGAFQAAANGISIEEAQERAATQIVNIEKAAVMN